MKGKMKMSEKRCSKNRKGAEKEESVMEMKRGKSDEILLVEGMNKWKGENKRKSRRREEERKR